MPFPGDVRYVPVITVSLQVGSTTKETRQVTYTPPPGWFVRSHTVNCTRKTGHSSFSVSTVPRDWTWCSEEQLSEAYRTLIELAGKAQEVGVQAELTLEHDRRLNELRRAKASHHALVVEATAKGEGFLRGGGSLELTVVAELVYAGTQDDLPRR
jgi:hypothetical protein